MNTPLTSDFAHLTPDHVLATVEDALRRPFTNLCRPLNSYINRVFEVQADDGEWIIAKFYRPGRWSTAALNDEMTFLAELAAEDIPVVAPLGPPGLRHDARGLPFALFPKRGGRPLVEPRPEQWQELGRLIARVHVVGARHPPEDRVELHPYEATSDHLDTILDFPFPHHSLHRDYEDIAEAILETIAPLFEDIPYLRIHGDCHSQNILARPGEPLTLIDFDDMAIGPAIQDLWMLLPDHLKHARQELDLILDGYRSFRTMPPREVNLIEPLRAMRFIHYTAWCVRQRADGGFARLAPDFGTPSYWKQEIDDLQRQQQEILDSLEARP
ncbi:MAG TPA: serine/threonine protein kinase [Kiritimatiellia bacterium]|mgnify:CR=1 FL=1|nr:serine/threonine protein kinase [Kiritimatiellia bacterium]